MIIETECLLFRTVLKILKLVKSVWDNRGIWTPYKYTFLNRAKETKTGTILAIILQLRSAV